ncbi:MAG: hypothetical protein R2713_02620 [Ilumatobacteraceae bacterium]
MWGRALDAGEVAAIAAAGLAGKCSFIPVEQGKFVPDPGPFVVNGRFGQSVGVSGTTVVAGSPYSSLYSQFGGALYVAPRPMASPGRRRPPSSPDDLARRLRRVVGLDRRRHRRHRVVRQQRRWRRQRRGLRVPADGGRLEPGGEAPPGGGFGRRRHRGDGRGSPATRW